VKSNTGIHIQKIHIQKIHIDHKQGQQQKHGETMNVARVFALVP